MSQITGSHMLTGVRYLHDATGKRLPVFNTVSLLWSPSARESLPPAEFRKVKRSIRVAMRAPRDWTVALWIFMLGLAGVLVILQFRSPSGPAVTGILMTLPLICIHEIVVHSFRLPPRAWEAAIIFGFLVNSRCPSCAYPLAAPSGTDESKRTFRCSECGGVWELRTKSHVALRPEKPNTVTSDL